MTIAKRIEKIETLIKSPAGAVLLREPPFDAPTAEHADHAERVATALRQKTVLIVRRNGTDRLRRSGVIYVDDDFAATLAILAHTPATDHQSKDRLSQIVIEAQGTTFPIFRGVRHGG